MKEEINKEISSIETVTLQNVEVQQNGIIRNSKGHLIGRLVDSVDFEGEYIKLLNESSEYDLDENPIFEAIWQAIKKWDIERDYGQGRAGATGTDVKIILNAIEPFLKTPQ